MSGFDFTQVHTGNTPRPVQAQPVPQTVPQATQQATTNLPPKDEVVATISKPVIPEKKQELAEQQGVELAGLWNPMSEARPGGQFKPGEVDEQHAEFLKKTEWDTAPVKDHIFKNRRIS